MTTAVLTTEQIELLIAAAERGYQTLGVCKLNLFYEIDDELPPCACVVGAMLQGFGKSRRYRQDWKRVLAHPRNYPDHYQENSSNAAAKLVLRTVGIDANVRGTFLNETHPLFYLLWHAHDRSASLDDYYVWLRSLASA